jgi:hypothetical protein
VEKEDQVDLGEMMAQADLEQVKQATAREEQIRYTMAETGESREIVEEMVGALEAMQSEAVLGLTEGNPTTLRAALIRYVEDSVNLLDTQEMSIHQIIGDLDALLHYRWPGEETIPDGPHDVQLSSTDRRSMMAWLERPNGSWVPDKGSGLTLTLNAVEGGGVLLRTRKYASPAGWGGTSIKCVRRTS